MQGGRGEQHRPRAVRSCQHRDVHGLRGMLVHFAGALTGIKLISGHTRVSTLTLAL